MNCEQIRALLEAHALSALDADETQAVDAHLAGCSACRWQVDEYAQTLSHLAEAAPALAAPDAVKARVMASVRAERSTTARRTWSGWPSGRWWPTLVAVQTVVLVVLGWAAVDMRLSQERAAQRSNALEQAVDILLAGGPDTRFLSASVQAPKGSWGRLYTHPGLDVVVVLVADTPAAPIDAEYRFWFRQGERFIPAGVVHVVEANRGWLVADKPAAFDGVLVTLDPKGSRTDAPAGPTILSADYS